jgi:hypothetical protein
MKQYFFASALLIFATACNNSETNPNSSSASAESSSYTAEELLDSANTMIGEFGVSKEAIQLIEQSLGMDPTNKRAHQKLISIYTATGEYENLRNALGSMSVSFPNDPYTTLHLAMEDELQDASATPPLENYEKAFNLFLEQIDSLKTNQDLIRKGNILNSALAARLAELPLSNASEVASQKLQEEEVNRFKEYYSNFENSSREVLLNSRRN